MSGPTRPVLGAETPDKQWARLNVPKGRRLRLRAPYPGEYRFVADPGKDTVPYVLVIFDNEGQIVERRALFHRAPGPRHPEKLSERQIQQLVGARMADAQGWLA